MFKHMCMFMVTKTITVTEEAYRKLASNKKPGESFSQLISRSFTKKGDISRFIGAWSDVPDKVIENMKNDIEKRRKIAGKSRMGEVLKHLS